MSASCLAAFGLEKNYFLQKMHQFSRLQTKESESLVVINETPSPQSAPHPKDALARRVTPDGVAEIREAERDGRRGTPA